MQKYIENCSINSIT